MRRTSDATPSSTSFADSRRYTSDFPQPGVPSRNTWKGGFIAAYGDLNTAYLTSLDTGDAILRTSGPMSLATRIVVALAASLSIANFPRFIQLGFKLLF